MAAPIKFRGRDVVINVVTFGDLMDGNARQEETGKTQDALWFVVHKAATYVDDGSLVFATPEDIRKTPATEAGAVMKMMAEAARLNMPDVAVTTNPI